MCNLLTEIDIQELEEIFKEDIPQEFIPTIIKVLVYLDNQGHNVEKYINIIFKTAFCYSDEKEVIAEFKTEIENEPLYIPVENPENTGGFVIPFLFPTEKKKITNLCNVLCIRKTSFEDLEERLCHELYHLFSIRNDIIKTNKYVRCQMIGFQQVFARISRKDIKMLTTKKGTAGTAINEAATELLSKMMITKTDKKSKIYFKSNPYTFVDRLQDIEDKEDFYPGYFLITGVMKYINFLLEKENDTSILEDLYFKNNIKGFYKLLYDEFDCSEEEINNLFEKTFIYTNEYFDFSEQEITEEDVKKFNKKTDEYIDKVLISFISKTLIYSLAKIQHFLSIDIRDKKITLDEASMALDDFEKTVINIFLDTPILDFLVCFVKEHFRYYRTIYGTYYDDVVNKNIDILVNVDENIKDKKIINTLTDEEKFIIAKIYFYHCF